MSVPSSRFARHPVIPSKVLFQPSTLGIPGELEVFDMMALGYPAIQPRPRLMRDPKDMVHDDDCGIEDFRNAEEVRDFVKGARNWNIGSHRWEQRVLDVFEQTAGAFVHINYVPSTKPRTIFFKKE